ncbi:hypothetical protein G8J22_00649 [Lentilactobacillus hilgardii]|jgi:hypothetical protein|uniref:ABC-2 transporter permease n=1 Tax=Lentilactobacillus hilgardii TaxID=1588 RepID=UPI00019C4C4A|nr:ABC-2 transporter permease [Lentilactobacillus hilgardii]EEI20229.1 hypothetical protein HMPREF0497_0949 [Lentilactobacillus buchneri ATCC 11577]MCP9350237.1 ABC-2 transporter permease [Lentilactobacillus hilgardii]MCP9353113.1 ABC-2 transporter permease [Lentilactobacillus hilgardii]MCT3396331.1 hypothetical protein [Lentilactobacillus hilgardii]QIR08715.1 hypothetical protein G8J22_00649 [Lentilactobacillus hilgardii]
MTHVTKVARLDMESWPVRTGALGIILIIDVLLLGLAYLKFSVFITALGFMTGLSVAGLIMPFYTSQGHNLDGMFALFNFQRAEIVLGHFLYGLGFIVTIVLNCLIVGNLMTILFPSQGDFKMVPALCLALSGFLILLLSIQYPLAIKLDYDKSPWIVILPLFALMLIVPIVGTRLFDIGPIGAILCMLGVAVLLGVSIWLSIRIYQKKEF